MAEAEMRAWWKSWVWTLLWATTTFEPTAAQSIKRKLGPSKWDRIHDVIQGQKRDVATCPTDYQLCPKSMNGGCCPSDRACGTSSCYPTTAATQTACARSGYIACGIDDGGGCCPASYSCFQNGCSPLPGLTYSQTCGVDSYLCPASLSYGCCKIGMACGIDNCYSTAITTVTMTDTVTTTSDSQTYTTTMTVVTAVTPQAPTPLPTSSSGDFIIPKVGVSATPIAKATASSTPRTGLTMPEIGGIIGGAVTLLLILLVAACIILRRLNRAIKVSEAAKSRRSRSSSEPTQTRRTRNSGQSYQKRSRSSKIDFDAISNDPFLMNESEDSPSTRLASNQSNIYSPELDSTEISPPIFTSPFSPRSPPSSHTRSPRGYKSIPNTEQGYFDIPPHKDPAIRDQNLRFGHTSTRRPSQHARNYSDVSDRSLQTRRPSNHARNWSDVSEQSQPSQGPTELSELDAGRDGQRRWSLQTAMQSFGMDMFRRKSEPRVEGRQSYHGPSNDTALLAHIDELREPAGDFENVPLTEMSNAQLRHVSFGSLDRQTGPLSGAGGGEQGREQREDT